MTSLIDLVQYIKDEASVIAERNQDDRTAIEAIFQNSISKTLKEIKNGANSEEFPDLVVINMIIDSAKENYSVSEIKSFVDSITAVEHGEAEVPAADEVTPANDEVEQPVPSEAPVSDEVLPLART